MGFLTDNYGFEMNFLLYGILGFTSVGLIAVFVPNKPSSPTGEATEAQIERGSLCDLAKIYLSPRVLFFCLELLVMGAAIGTVERLLFVYLIDDLGASTLLCGLTVGVTVMLELPIFWYAGTLLRVFRHDGMAAMAMACFVVRTYGYTLLTPHTVSWILCLEIMHGITFACFWVAIMDITKLLSSRASGWNTTIPVVTNTLFGCVGYGLGGILGGWAMEKYSSKIMYGGVSKMILMLLTVHSIGSGIARYSQIGSFLPVNNPSEDMEEGPSSSNDNVFDSDCDENATLEVSADDREASGTDTT